MGLERPKVYLDACIIIYLLHDDRPNQAATNKIVNVLLNLST